MSDLKVVAWKRHGHDRLYANLPDGTAVAWADRRTREVTILVNEYRREAVELLRLHLAGEPRPRTHPTSPLRPDRPPGTRRRKALPELPPLTTADDLAQNRPGAELLALIAARGPSITQRTWAKMLRRSSEWDPWYIGLAGERRVGAELARLSSYGWRVLHGVPKPNGGDIDHLLIGPGGVFSVNTKHHNGKSVWVGDTMARIDHGKPMPYAAASKAEAEHVRTVLERHCGFVVPVEPVLVFVGVTELNRAATQYAVRIYQEREVSALGPVNGGFTPEQIEKVHTVARHRRAWLRA